MKPASQAFRRYEDNDVFEEGRMSGEALKAIAREFERLRSEKPEDEKEREERSI